MTLLGVSVEYVVEMLKRTLVQRVHNEKQSSDVRGSVLRSRLIDGFTFYRFAFLLSKFMNYG